MNDILYFLKHTKQTEISDEIKKLGKSLKGPNELSIVYNVVDWLKKQKFTDLPHKDRETANKIFRKRSADKILQDGFFTGCSDYALVAATIFRFFGIPTKISQVVSSDWLNNEPSKIVGHVLNEIYIFDQWLVLDPLKGSLGFSYSSLNFILVKVGRDFKEMELVELDKLNAYLDDFKKNQ